MATDNLVMTGPNFQQVGVGALLVTPTGGAQSALGDVLGGKSAGGAVVAITPGTSPYDYVAANAGVVAVDAGTVSAIAIIRGGTSVPTGVTSGTFSVLSGDTLAVTYSAAPTMNFLPVA